MCQELKGGKPNVALNVEKICAKWDRDGNKKVSFAEFKARMSEYLVNHPEGKKVLHSAAVEKSSQNDLAAMQTPPTPAELKGPDTRSPAGEGQKRAANPRLNITFPPGSPSEGHPEEASLATEFGARLKSPRNRPSQSGAKSTPKAPEHPPWQDSTAGNRKASAGGKGETPSRPPLYPTPEEQQLKLLRHKLLAAAYGTRTGSSQSLF